MGRQIIQKSDGIFAIWSSVVDDFILDDATEVEVVAAYVEHAAYNAAREALTTIRQIQDGTALVTQFSLAYEQACRIRDRIHQEA